MLKLEKELLAHIKQHGEQAFPEECIGVLLGNSEGEARNVNALYPIENSAEFKRTEFAVSQAELQKAEQAAASQNLDVIGFYHSHADFEAAASQKDRAFAIPGFSYPIVSVLGGKAAAVKSFAFIGGTKNANFTEEEIVCL